MQNDRSGFTQLGRGRVKASVCSGKYQEEEGESTSGPGGAWTSNPHDKTKSTNLGSQIHLDSHPSLRGPVKVNLRSEIGRFGVIVRVGGRRGYHPAARRLQLCVQCFRSGFLFAADKLLHHSTLGLRVKTKKREMVTRVVPTGGCWARVP